MGKIQWPTPIAPDGAVSSGIFFQDKVIDSNARSTWNGVAIQLSFERIGQIVVPDRVFQIPRVRDHAIDDFEFLSFALWYGCVAGTTINIHRFVIGGSVNGHANTPNARADVDVLYV